MSDSIARSIREQRIAQGMTQEELASAVFTTRQTISNYENGKSKPDYEMIGKIAVALGVDAEALIYDIDDSRKKKKLWIIAVATLFCCLLARSFRYSSLLLGLGQHSFLVYEQGYITAVLPAVCCIAGWWMIRFYELYCGKQVLHLQLPQAVLLFTVLLLALWFSAAVWQMVQLYAAAADPTRNSYGGPVMLGEYVASFYHKYIVVVLAQLPILNSIFVIIGSAFAVSLNGKRC